MLYAAGNWVLNWVIGWGGVGALISIGTWALWYFTPPFLTDSKSVILHVAVVASAITLSSTYLSAHYFNLGYRTAIDHIASQNKEASDAVKKAISNVDQCDAAGGTWDTVGGVCQR